MAIVRLALANPAANTNTLLHTATRQSLISVISTNTASATAEVDIWVQPVGASATSQYAYMAKNTVLPGNNSLETFRFALETDDAVYIRSTTASVSFSINAIYESTANYNKVTISSTAPNAPTIGDVWINSTNSSVNFWNGSSWVNAVSVSGVSSVNGLTGAVTGIATLSSPTFTGIPAAPTAAADTNTTQIATTAYVIGQGYAKLASPTLTGTPAAPTASPGTNTTQIATTAYVTTAVAAAGGGGLDPFFLGGM